MGKIDKFLDYKLMDHEDIPKIPLYIDQVTSFLEEVFSDIRLNEADKVLTKTMINNYVKAQVLASPVKKKYSKDQIMKLEMLYLLKNTLSLNQIDSLFHDDTDLEDLYDYFKACDLQGREGLKADQDQAKSERYILKLLLASQLQKRYAELLLEDLMKDKAPSVKDKEDKNKKDK